MHPLSPKSMYFGIQGRGKASRRLQPENSGLCSPYWELVSEALPDIIISTLTLLSSHTKMHIYLIMKAPLGDPAPSVMFHSLFCLFVFFCNRNVHTEKVNSDACQNHTAK